MSKTKNRWICFCVMPARDVMRDHPHHQNGGSDEVRESAANAGSTSSSIHYQKEVNISSRSGGLPLQSKKGDFLRRILKRITKRIPSSIHLLSSSGAPNPEQRPAPRAGNSTEILMTSGNSETTFYSINTKPQINPNPVAESSLPKHDTGMMSLPPADAPEVLRKDAYGKAVDIWSAGVVLCKMLTREMPFDSCDLQAVRNLDFSLPHWKHVPDEARHLVSRMLEYDPQNRITAAQILEHPWIKEHNEM